jgi:hypothetical protein
MKQIKQSVTRKAGCGICSFLFMLSGSTLLYGQVPAAPSVIEVGTQNSAFAQEYTQNTTSSGFVNSYGTPCNEAVCHFRLGREMNIVISNCGSSVQDTRMYLFSDESGLIAGNDDYYGPDSCNNPLQACIAKTLPAGSYYVFSEGYRENGNITTRISGTLPAAETVSDFEHPILVGNSAATFSWSHTVSTDNCTNTFNKPKGPLTNDVFYRFNLSEQTNVVITHCGSYLPDTYLALFNASGNLIDINDDYSGLHGCDNKYHSVIRKTLYPGSYYAVSEGYGINGSITTTISGEPTADKTGNTFENPIVLGNYNAPFQWSDAQNTEEFTNGYGQSCGEVFYRFTLESSMNITVSHCRSSLPDTYIHLLKADGSRLSFSDDSHGSNACENEYHARLEIYLDPGTYYIVSEGYRGEGNITTDVTGDLATSHVKFTVDAAGRRILTEFVMQEIFAVSEVRNSAISSGLFAGPQDPGPDTSKDEEKQFTGFNPPVEGTYIASAIYPNPTEGLLTVSIPGHRSGVDGSLRLYGSTGKLLLSRKTTGKTEIINLSGYDRGMYVLVISAEGKIETHKLIKK